MRGQMPWHSTRSLARQSVRRWPERTQRQQWEHPGKVQWQVKRDAPLDWQSIRKEPQK